jgi:DNA-binding CsgD family transcriptional regulator
VNRSEAAEALRLHFGRETPARLAEQLSRRCGSAEVLSSILDQIDPEADGLTRVPVVFPKEVTSRLNDQLTTLTPESRAVLDAAAVLGREFDLALVEQMCAGADVLGSLTEAEQSGLVTSLPAQVFRFASAPAREICYDALNPKQRAELHERAAAALTALGALGGVRAATVAELAHHASEAAALGGPTRLDAAAAASVAAGAAANSTGSHDLAAAYFAQAATMAGRAGWPPQSSGRLLVAAGEARLRSAREPSARQAGRASLTGAIRMGTRVGDAGLIGAASLALGSPPTLGSLAPPGSRAPVDPTRQDALTQALMPGPGPSSGGAAELGESMAARLKARLALDSGDVSLAQESLTTADNSGDPRARAEAILALAELSQQVTTQITFLSSTGVKLSHNWAELLTQAVREAEALHDQELLARLLDLLATIAVRQSRIEAACGYLQVLTEIVSSMAFVRWYATRAQAELLLLQAQPFPEALLHSIALAGNAVDPAASQAHLSLLNHLTTSRPSATLPSATLPSTTPPSTTPPSTTPPSTSALSPGPTSPSPAVGMNPRTATAATHRVVTSEPQISPDRAAPSAADTGERPALAELTPREREIFYLALEGAPAREIAKLLTLAERTVETHLANIYRKLGIRTRVELITRFRSK